MVPGCTLDELLLSTYLSNFGLLLVLGTRFKSTTVCRVLCPVSAYSYIRTEIAESNILSNRSELVDALRWLSHALNIFSRSTRNAVRVRSLERLNSSRCEHGFPNLALRNCEADANGVRRQVTGQVFLARA